MQERNCELRTPRTRKNQSAIDFIDFVLETKTIKEIERDNLLVFIEKDPILVVTRFKDFFIRDLIGFFFVNS